MKLSKPPAHESGSLLSRLLDTPDLVGVVQSLEPRLLYQLIEHVGLEDASEIITLASTAQIERIFDDDLWRSEKIGRDESFDPERFGLWLEVLLEAGEQFAARRLTELDPDIVTLGFCRLVLVVDLDQMSYAMQHPGRQQRRLDKALESSLYHEFDQYQVIARRHDGWDAVLSILVALDRDHHNFLDHLLERCCHISGEYIEDNGGLYDVLTADETAAEDAAATRQDRRAAAGFIAPSDAVSFLELARTISEPGAGAADDYDPVTRAYFRSLETRTPRGPTRAEAHARPGAEPVASARDRFVQLLVDAEVLPDLQSAPLLAAVPEAATTGPRAFMAAALRQLEAGDPDLHGQRRKELNYLANVLIAGQPWQGRRLRPVEAAGIVLAVVALGWPSVAGVAGIAGAEGRPPGLALLRAHSFVKAFRSGWHLLHDTDASEGGSTSWDQKLGALIDAAGKPR